MYTKCGQGYCGNLLHRPYEVFTPVSALTHKLTSAVQQVTSHEDVVFFK